MYMIGPGMHVEQSVFLMFCTVIKLGGKWESYVSN